MGQQLRGNSTFKLRFPAGEIRRWAEHYSYRSEDRIVNELAPQARRQGYLVRERPAESGILNCPASCSQCAWNPAELIAEPPRTAHSASCERLRTGVLPLLDHAARPPASLLPQKCRENPPKILDSRALWSLRVPAPTSYTVSFMRWHATAHRTIAPTHWAGRRAVCPKPWRNSQLSQTRRRKPADRATVPPAYALPGVGSHPMPTLLHIHPRSWCKCVGPIPLASPIHLSARSTAGWGVPSCQLSHCSQPALPSIRAVARAHPTQVFRTGATT